jgi:hypothetical protein
VVKEYLQTSILEKLLSRLLGLVLILVFFCEQSQAQSTVLGAGSPDPVVEKISLRYDSLIGSNSILFNGPEYVNSFEKKLVEGHPYYKSSDWQPGYIMLNGQTYNQISFRYDLFLDKIVLDHPTHHRMIELVDFNVTSFKLGDAIFVRLESPYENFHRVLYEGSLNLFASYSKVSQEIINANSKTITIIEKSKYLIIQNNKYHPITTKSTFLIFFQDRKTEVSQFIRKSKLSFKKDKEYFMITVAQYYDQISDK